MKRKLISLALIFLIAVLMYVLGVSCLFKAAFHIPCPGCGITRAYLSLLRLDIRSAFRFNFMFWSVPLLIVSYLFDGTLLRSKSANTLVHALILFGFFANWILNSAS